MFLSVDEVVRLTGKLRYSAQRRALNRLGIRYTTAATGEPLVRIEALDPSGSKARNKGPHWDKIT
jgi:hypothetical protein